MLVKLIREGLYFDQTENLGEGNLLSTKQPTATPYESALRSESQNTLLPKFWQKWNLMLNPTSLSRS